MILLLQYTLIFASAIHNIRFLNRLVNDIKKAIWEDRLRDFRDEFFETYEFRREQDKEAFNK